MIEVDMDRFMGDWVRGRLAEWCMGHGIGSEDGARMYTWACRDGLDTLAGGLLRRSSYANSECSWLYALKTERYGYTKIGRSTKPWQRLHQLKKTWGQEVEFTTLPVYEELVPERDVHQLLRDHRLPQLGAGRRRDGDTEWFLRNETVLAFESAMYKLVNGGL